MNILLVDDDREMHLAFKLVFKDATLKVATNKIEALQVLSSFKPDVIFMDIFLPGSDDGYSTAKAIHDQYGSQYRIIAVTAHYTDDTRIDLQAGGFAKFAYKPVEAAKLRALAMSA